MRCAAQEGNATNPVFNGSLQDPTESLVSRCRMGDTRAWDEFYKRFSDRIYGCAFRIVCNREDAEDVTAISLERICSHIGSFRSNSALIPWIFRIVHNTAITFLRHKHSRPSPAAMFTSTDDGEFLELEPMDPAESPEELVVSADNIRRLGRDLERLPLLERDLLEQVYSRGLSYVQIADRAQIPLGTVKSRLSRARAHLRCLAISAGDGDLLPED